MYSLGFFIVKENMTDEQKEEIEIALFKIKDKCLVFDLETSSYYPDGREVNIKTNFDDYVKYAQIKWIGLYSYRFNKYYSFNCNQSMTEARTLLASHEILIGFNSEDFDLPILTNNKFLNEEDKHTSVDCMTILGKASFYTKKGFPFKNRGTLMDYDFESNSLRHIAEVMKLETQKGDIDYRIFQRSDWTEEEKKEIETYLKSDVLATKQMFDKLWSYWLPFTEFLPLKSIEDLSWIRGSIASVVYKSCCHLLGVEATYADKKDDAKEEMGGNVLLPQVEAARGVWYLDFASLYPHIMTQFNLFSEVDASLGGKYIWHGNDVFKVKGYYETARQHPLSALVRDFLKKRIELKKTDPKNPMVYTYKIFLNGLYGVVRSSIFEQVHKPSAGWDTCSLGQQCQKLLIDMMAEFGFKTIYGDTDSAMLVAVDEKNNNEVYVKECIKKVIDKIFANVPFPADTFNIAVEHHMDYIMFPFEEQDNVDELEKLAINDLFDIPVINEELKITEDDVRKKQAIVAQNLQYGIKDEGKKKIIFNKETGKILKIGRSWVKERRGKKKNYCYIYTEKDGTKKVEVKGFPIIKNNATKLGFEIFDNVLKAKIANQGHAKFPKTEIDNIINDYLKKPDAMDWISVEYKVKPAASYKKESQIHAQISKAYFNGSDGVIRLIKNSKIGKVGLGTKYCSLEEALEQKLTVSDLDLEKVMNELSPFIVSDKGVESAKSERRI